MFAVAFAIAWWSGGSLWSYACLLGLCIAGVIGTIVFFGFAEMLVTVAVDLKLQKVGAKVRVLLEANQRETQQEISDLKRALEALRSKEGARRRA